MTLKPCPFCGSHIAPMYYSDKTFQEDHNIEPDDISGYYIICSALNGGCGAMSGWMEDSDTTASKWNRRTLKLQTKRRS